MTLFKNKKVILVVALISVTIMAISACRKQTSVNNQVEQAQTQTQVQEKTNVLIAYFSLSGNTKAVAEYIQSFIGATLFEITTEQTYPGDWDTLIAKTREELNTNFRPALAEKIEDIGNYDTIFVGFPIWFSTVPMAILSFLESYDFTGKTIIPFSTRGSGTIGESVTRIRDALPNSTVLDGFHDVNRANFSQAQELTESWINTNFNQENAE